MVDRVFRAIDRFGTNTEFELVTPTLAIENEGERQYRIAYSKALAEGIFPRNKLREIMKKHGMWTDEDDMSLKNEVASLAILQTELEQHQLKGEDIKCLEVAHKMQKHRIRMWELFMIQQSVYLNSVEGMAELIKSEAVMAACINVKASNKRYWESYTDFVKERDENSIATVYIKAVEVQSNLLMELRDSVEASNPENKYLKDAKQRMFERDVEERVALEIEERKKKALDGVTVENKATETTAST